MSKSIEHWGESPYASDWADNRVFNNIFSNSTNFGSNHYGGANLTSGTNALLTDPANGNFIPQANSPAVDAGVAIPGITDGFTGSAPDIGALERGVQAWTAGHNFASPPNPVYALSNTPWKNKVKQGGFSSLTPWTKLGSTTVANPGSLASPSWAKRGLSNVLKLSGSGGGGVQQTVTGLLPNTNYRLSAWVYVEGGESVRLGVKNYGGSEVTLDATNSQFTRRTLGFTTGSANTTATISFTKTTSNGSQIYVDDAGVVPTVLEAVPSGTVTPTEIDTSGNVTFGTDGAAYGTGQDASNGQPSTLTVSGADDSATLTGNAWKAFPLSYTVTANTVLKVTVNASDAGEILGISLDDDQANTTGRRAFLFGGSQYGSGSFDAWSWD